jgi:peptide chain release factor 1
VTEKFNDIIQRFEQIELQLQDPEVVTNPSKIQELGKARAELEPKAQLVRKYQKALTDLSAAKELINDPEFKDLAAMEIEQLTEEIGRLDEELKLMLIPKDPNDDKPVIIEIRPAAGGDEAGLFASQLFRMYTRYAERHRWKYTVMEHEDTGIGGISRVVFSIDASGAYSQLKHESGVHRVQRVPATETGGRIHTSTVTVAVLPEVEDVDVVIKDSDLEISTFISSSAGGQHMQKNETAIRIVHKPTGIVVTCQDERSQLQNKLKSMQALRAKLYEAEQERLAKERGELRKGQIGSGDRSEKIRTYNFPQSRITDHRIGYSEHNMITFMDGDIDDMVSALVKREMEVRLAEAVEKE